MLYYRQSDDYLRIAQVTIPNTPTVCDRLYTVYYCTRTIHLLHTTLDCKGKQRISSFFFL